MLAFFAVWPQKKEEGRAHARGNRGAEALNVVDVTLAHPTFSLGDCGPATSAQARRFGDGYEGMG